MSSVFESHKLAMLMTTSQETQANTTRVLLLHCHLVMLYTCLACNYYMPGLHIIRVQASVEMSV